MSLVVGCFALLIFRVSSSVCIHATRMVPIQNFLKLLLSLIKLVFQILYWIQLELNFMHNVLLCCFMREFMVAIILTLLKFNVFVGDAREFHVLV